MSADDTPDFIPIYDPAPHTDPLAADLRQAADRVLASGAYVLGPEVTQFEQEAAKYLGVRHAIGVNSGTDALVVSLMGMGIGPGDEVITSPFTFFATAEAVSLVGATPRFVDIDPLTFNMDLAQVDQAVTPRTRAVIPVHLYGRAMDMAALRDLAERRELRLLEDAAQAFGAETGGSKVGGWGDAAAFSFYPTKNLGGFGDGGLITTNDDALAERCRVIRAHGSPARYRHERIGVNSRLDALQAALLRVKLPHIDDWNAARREAAGRYQVLLADIPGLQLPESLDDARHVYHQYTVRVAGGMRDRVHQGLDGAGVGSLIYYPVPLHRQPVYASEEVALPVSEQAAEQVLSLPMWPGIEEATQTRVAEALRRVMEQARGA